MLTTRRHIPCVNSRCDKESSQPLWQVLPWKKNTAAPAHWKYWQCIGNVYSTYVAGGQSWYGCIQLMWQGVILITRQSCCPDVDLWTGGWWVMFCHVWYKTVLGNIDVWLDVTLLLRGAFTVFVLAPWFWRATREMILWGGWGPKVSMLQGTPRRFCISLLGWDSPADDHFFYSLDTNINVSSFFFNYCMLACNVQQQTTLWNTDMTELHRSKRDLGQAVMNFKQIFC